MTVFNIFIWSQVCDFHPLAEGSKRIQSFLVLGGVTHHGVVAASSLQQGGNTRGRGDRSKLSIHQPLKHPNWVYFVPANQTGHQKQRISQTYSAWVALQKFDFLIEFDVVRSQAVQFILQGLHGLLHGATLLQASEGTKGRGISPPGKETHEYTCVCARAHMCVWLTASSSWLRERNLSLWLEMMESSESIWPWGSSGWALTPEPADKAALTCRESFPLFAWLTFQIRQRWARFIWCDK